MYIYVYIYIYCVCVCVCVYVCIYIYRYIYTHMSHVNIGSKEQGNKYGAIYRRISLQESMTKSKAN